jgi:hypothetical protein
VLLKSNKRVVFVKDQTHDHGYHFYTQQARAAAAAAAITTTNNNTNNHEEEEADFNQVFGDVWNVLFTPSHPVQALIDQNMQELRLVPGHYVTIHVRSKYKVNKSNNREMIHNSINCAFSTMQLLPKNNKSWPIYFASDSSSATSHAMKYVAHQGKKNASSSSSSGILAFRKTDQEPLHLDRTAWRNNTVSDFYNVFVDLYLLANSACSIIGIGGFGKWGALMSYNASCIVRHDRNKCPATWKMMT